MRASSQALLPAVPRVGPRQIGTAGFHAAILHVFRLLIMSLVCFEGCVVGTGMRLGCPRILLPTLLSLNYEPRDTSNTYRGQK